MLVSREMKVPNIVAAIALLLAVALGFLFFQARDQAVAARQEAEALRAATNELTAQIAELETKRVNEADLGRLQADQRDALKLRAEVATLKNAVAAAEKAKAAAEQKAASKPAPPKAPIPVEQNPEARILNSKAVANLPQGYGLALGGWQTKPGRRAFALISPALDAANPETVAVATKWIEVSDEGAGKLNLAALLPGAGQHAALSAEQLNAIIKSVEQTAGADIISSPMVTTLSGRQARVSVSNTRPTAGGDVEFGPRIDLVPTQRPDGSVDLAVDATLTLPVNAE